MKKFILILITCFIGKAIFAMDSDISQEIEKEKREIYEKIEKPAKITQLVIFKTINRLLTPKAFTILSLAMLAFGGYRLYQSGNNDPQCDQCDSRFTSSSFRSYSTTP